MPQTDIKISSEELEGTSATLSRWLFNVGDIIEVDAPIIELETDKVSMEICAPCNGILTKILIHSGEDVEAGTLLGVIENKNNTQPLISPAVRKLLQENNLDIEQIEGTGKEGRVNRQDVLAFISESNALPTQQKSSLVPHTNIRKSIAKHMVDSLLHTSPHVTSFFEMDMSKIIEHRKLVQQQYAKNDIKLTYTAYFLYAMVQAIRQVPEINAQFHQEALEIFKDINIGVATALGNKGLVVPVVKKAQSMTLFDLANTLTQQTIKARDDSLKPADLTKGTITLSNHGVSGSLFAAPIIINQPEVAILGIGKVEKRVIVQEVNQQDMMIIKPMCYVSLSIDHRAIDGYQANQFLTKFVATIESWVS